MPLYFKANATFQPSVSFNATSTSVFDLINRRRIQQLRVSDCQNSSKHLRPAGMALNLISNLARPDN